MGQNFSTLTFTDSVLNAQERYGSRRNWNGEENEPDRFLLTDRETDFIAGLDGFFMATVGENDWPYMQFRGGPKGFLKVLDDRHLAFADFRGNRQYISTGNLNSGGKAMLFPWDQARRMRLKVWVTGEVSTPDEHDGLAEQLTDQDHRGKVERLMVFTVQAFDWNCPQHITPHYTAEEFATLNPDSDLPGAQPTELNQFP
jgi:uncharacterized protein